MARSDPQFNLRIPADLKQRIETAAKASGRSATSEIIARLESTFEGQIARSAPESGRVHQILQTILQNQGHLQIINSELARLHHEQTENGVKNGELIRNLSYHRDLIAKELSQLRGALALTE